MTVSIDAYRALGEKRAQQYLEGIRLAAAGQPRSACRSDEALRGWDQMTRRLEVAA